MNTITLDPAVLQHNLSILADYKKGAKLNSDILTHKIEKDERTWFVALRRYRSGFHPESVAKTYHTAILIMQQACFNPSSDEKLLETARTLNDLMDLSLMGLVELINTYVAEKKENMYKPLNQIHTVTLDAYSDLPRHLLRKANIPTPPVPPAKKERLGKGSLTQKVKKLGFSIKLYELKNIQLNKTGRTLIENTPLTLTPIIHVPIVKKAAEIKPRIVINTPLSEKAKFVREMLKKGKKGVAKEEFTEELSNSIILHAQKTPSLPIEIVKKKEPSPLLNYFNTNLLAKEARALSLKQSGEWEDDPLIRELSQKLRSKSDTGT